ncbi:GntR family transcriptional regulator [Psychromonas sp. L1A2]|uniref:GntR family transcriptional regulator n=1 Tax=Psychromonas sp. L1A2 TaxID=2686356 RepID=UPI001357FCC7|nr:GntR family transcriptional regulator [Psychromonas sp. L1A2]
MTKTATKASTNKQQEIQRIISKLSKAVAQHKLKPGQRLVEAQIVEALNANRNHVQSALQRLALQHIVTIEPNRGSFVAQPSAQEAREIFAARRVVERGIIENITQQTIQDNWQKIELHMESEQQVTQGNDRRAIVSTLSHYHKLLAEMCGNTVLKEMFENLMVRSSLIVALYQHNDVPSCQHNEHQDIIDALKEGNQALAAKVMLQHLQHLESELVLDNTQSTATDLVMALKEL